MQVEIYAGTEKVRLYLNDKLIGEMPTTAEQQRKALFTVAYAPGVLKAVGINSDREVAASALQTVDNPAKLRMAADRSELHADGQDLSFITVEAVDAEGRPQLNANQEVKFAVSGSGSIVAVGNGDGPSRESYQGDHIALFHGRALVVLRASRLPGTVHLTADADGLRGAEIRIQSRTAKSVAELEQ